MQTCLAKMVSCASRNQFCPSSNLIAIGKISTVKDSNKAKYGKSKVDINLSHNNFQVCRIYLPVTIFGDIEGSYLW